MDRRRFMAGCAGLSLMPTATGAFAQSGPLTKIVYPFAAGAGGGAFFRLLAQHLRPLLDRTGVVEKPTGADGPVRVKSTMKASPDRTTDLVTTRPTMYLLPRIE